MSTAIELLRELAALKHYGKNGHPRRSEHIVTINLTTDLLERIDAALAPEVRAPKCGHTMSGECTEACYAPPAVATPASESAAVGRVSVDRGALHAVINMLRRDAEEGRTVRGEMADDLTKGACSQAVYATDRQAYVFLQAGDTVRATDEYLDDDLKSWQPVTTEYWLARPTLRG